jgi:hypothetical protein
MRTVQGNLKKRTVQGKKNSLLIAITDRLVARSSLGHPTHLRKVKAHSGVRGNELVDQGAAATLTPTATHAFTVAAANNSVLTLPAWPHAVADDTTGATPPTVPLQTSHRPSRTPTLPCMGLFEGMHFHHHPHRHPSQGQPSSHASG